MRRIPWRLAIPLAIGLAGAGVWIANSLFVSAQPQERVVVRPAPPSCAESVVELDLQGQEVHCVEPPAPTTEEPRSHGPYRLIPPGYVGTLSYQYVGPAQAPRGVITSDMAVLQASSLYKAPSYMPDGYSLSSMDTFDGDSETIIRAVYRGPGQPIEIYRVRRYERPIDVYMPPSDAVTVIEAATLDGKPAIFSYPRPGSFLDGKGFTRVSFVEGEIETTVMGPGLDLESAVRIAASVEAGGPVSEMTTGVLDLNQGDDGTSGQAVVNAAPPVSATEHRIIEGIATNSALVYTWWHGVGYGQTALDLHKIPEGETPGADVYYQSYAWTGPAGFLASVLYYPGTCTGVRVGLLDAGWNTVGLVDYVHIQSSVSVGQWWPVWGSGWTSRHVGTVLADESLACKNQVPPGWTGAHLHHARNNGYPYIQENADLQNYLIQQNHPNVIQPAYDYINQWVFRAFTIDADGDGCTDAKEAAMGFNAHNYWDFYDVPVPANRDPTPNGPRNRAVNMADVLAVLFYVGAYNGDGGAPNGNGVSYDSYKDADWNGDTVVNSGDKVGLRYDRSAGAPPNPPWDAGPPSGAVAMNDVLAVMAQVGLSCM